MYEEIVEKIKDRLKGRALNAVIIPHISPDGDAVGSCSALWQVLDKVGINAQLMTCDYIPDYLKWLNRIPDSISFQNRAKECKQWLNKADVLFMLDHNTVSREGDLEPYVRQFKGETIMIDHHPDPDKVTYMISDTRVSSTCELLYYVISEVWGKDVIDKGIANAIYTGISTDTGGLNHNSSHPATYRVIADLLELGLDKDYVHEQLYQRNTLSRLRLTGNCLLNKLDINEEYPVALIPITLQELETYHYKDGDLEGLVNVPLSIEEILVSVQITERKDKVKLSFRSKGNIPVNVWAKEFFNGGGHLNAAGGQMPLPLCDVVQKVRDTAEWFFGQLKNRE